MGVWAAIAVGGGAVGLVPRRRAHDGVLVAVDLLRERTGRNRRVHRIVADRPRVEGRACAQELRRRRRGDRDRRPAGARLRDREGAGEGLDVAAHRRLLSRWPSRCSSPSSSSSAARRSRSSVSASSACGRCAPPTSSCSSSPRGSSRCSTSTRSTSNACSATPRSRPASRSFRSRRGSSSGPGCRRASYRSSRAKCHHRDADGGGRPAVLHAAAAGRPVRHRPPPDRLASDRHGADVRADHAHRDERHPRRRRGPRIRPLQHVAADRRRLGLAILATLVDATGDAERARARTTAGGQDRRSWTASTSRTGSAALVAGGFVALLFLLSRRDVVAVGEGGETAPRARARLAATMPTLVGRSRARGDGSGSSARRPAGAHRAPPGSGRRPSHVDAGGAISRTGSPLPTALPGPASTQLAIYTAWWTRGLPVPWSVAWPSSSPASC